MICLIFRKNLRQKIVSQNLRLRMFLAMFSFSLGYFSLNVLIKNVLNKKSVAYFFTICRLADFLDCWKSGRLSDHWDTETYPKLPPGRLLRWQTVRLRTRANTDSEACWKCWKWEGKTDLWRDGGTDELSNGWKDRWTDGHN